MRTDTDQPTEKVSNIEMNSERFGSCNPDGRLNECTFYDCSRKNHGDYLTRQDIRSSGGQIDIELTFSTDVNSGPSCQWLGSNVMTAARVSLTPINGNLEIHLIARYINNTTSIVTKIK